MNKDDRAVLYGLAIGDGHISYRTRYKDGKYRYEQAELIIGHGPKQKEYLEYKADLITSILGGKRPKIAQTSHTLKSNGKTYVGYRLAKTAKYFRQMHCNLYKEGKKLITDDVLKYCDEKTLALWYLDDGSILQNKNKSSEVTSLSFRICTQFVDQQEADCMLNWLSSCFGIEAKKFMSKGKWDIGGATQATLLLATIIQDHVPACMAYKILPVTKFVIRKSARHPNFTLDDDIVRSAGNINL